MAFLKNFSNIIQLLPVRVLKNQKYVLYSMSCIIITGKVYTFSGERKIKQIELFYIGD